MTVKYRDNQVNVAAPGFIASTRADGKVLLRAWYDAPVGYLVVDLGGTLYHYCAFTASDWEALEGSANVDDHYYASIKERFDCREVGTVPDYGGAVASVPSWTMPPGNEDDGCEIELDDEECADDWGDSDWEWYCETSDSWECDEYYGDQGNYDDQEDEYDEDGDDWSEE